MSLAAARRILADAERIAVLTGAGVSAESGVPTFRGAGGLWKSFRAEELATPEAFARDPRLCWEWYGTRREMLRACRPNAAHLALARLALSRGGVTLVTQNVDELHADAARAEAGGAGEERDPAPALPLELHGSIWRARCTRCDHRRASRDAIDGTSEATLPHCDRCGAVMRPDVVWFGEMLDPAVLGAAERAASEAAVILVVGTSALVYPAAGLAGATRRGGGAVIEVNPEATPLSATADVVLRGPAADVVPALVEG